MAKIAVDRSRIDTLLRDHVLTLDERNFVEGLLLKASMPVYMSYAQRAWVMKLEINTINVRGREDDLMNKTRGYLIKNNLNMLETDEMYLVTFAGIKHPSENFKKWFNNLTFL